jgi:hypothetical protein
MPAALPLARFNESRVNFFVRKGIAKILLKLGALSSFNSSESKYNDKTAEVGLGITNFDYDVVVTNSSVVLYNTASDTIFPNSATTPVPVCRSDRSRLMIGA